MLLWKVYDFSGSAVDILALFRNHPQVFLLESSLTGLETGRYSFVGFEPFATLTPKETGGLIHLREHFHDLFPQDISRRCPTPFPCGMAGYLSYDAGMRFEKVRPCKPEPAGVPPILFNCYDAVITLDHHTRKLIITSSGLPEKKPRARRERARQRLEEISRKVESFLACPFPGGGEGPSSGNGRGSRLRSNMTRREYFCAVKKALTHIRRGDIYQVNLSQRFCFEVGKARPADPLTIYGLLRELSPSHFAAYFDAGGFRIISSSPEMFLHLKKGRVLTRPMKGTRPRGSDVARDRNEKEALLQSAKDKAELLMITDLERNDIGRVCGYGSVRVKVMRTLEEYRTVFQATSTIEGRLRRGKDCFDLLRASFPGGSITGCPKIRAMQVIKELEPSPRGIYTGSLGYINSWGDMHLNILIRTLLQKGRKVYFHVGGGIVADSTPAREYRETLVKAKAMRECLNRAGAPSDGQSVAVFLDGKTRNVPASFLERLKPGVFEEQGVFETMRAVRGRVALLDEHLKRLKKGLRVTGIAPYSDSRMRRIIKKVLEANHLSDARLRLMVWTTRADQNDRHRADQDDRHKGERHAAVMATTYPARQKGRAVKGYSAVISPVQAQRTPPQQRIKSLKYARFLKAFEDAAAKGYDEALLLNREGYLCEGSRTNIFFVAKGKIFTPELKAGCLNGIMRQWVMRFSKDTGFPVGEVRARPRDVACAQEAFLTNAVIGVAPLVKLNGRMIGPGRPGPITRRLRRGYLKSLRR